MSDEELDAAVAKVLGLAEATDGFGGQVWTRQTTHEFSGGPALEFLGYKRDLHLDWNALMAAVAIKQKQGYVFERSMDRWRVIGPEVYIFHFEPYDSQSEAEALAKCIEAVVEAIND